MAATFDPCDAFAGLLTVDALLPKVAHRFPALRRPADSVRLDAAVGRVLAEPVVAGLNMPPQDNSAMDGYAVRWADLSAGEPTVLTRVGRSAAGRPSERICAPGEAVRIFTGAALPVGADTVVMQEVCLVDGERITVPADIERGANRRRAGEDIAVGQICLPAGRRLRTVDIGVAAALGCDHLMVRPRLRVAILSNGDELREIGQPLAPTCIFDSNRPMLRALLRSLDCDITDLGIQPDRVEVIRDALTTAMAGHDLVIATGGMSVGEEDHVKTAVSALGSLDFWRLAIKPGKPVAVGQIGAVPFIGLPGNPVAVLVTFLLVARPLILSLLGAEIPPLAGYPVVAGFDHSKPVGRRDFLRGRLVRDPAGTFSVIKFRSEGSHMLSSLAESDGLIDLAEATSTVERGQIVRFIPFPG